MKDLCLKLAKCNSADEVKKVLKKEGLWDDDKYWENIGSIENNYTTIGNQQASPMNALIEKVVNSSDSILTSKVIEDGIDPEDVNLAPKSVKEAMDKYLGIKNMDITTLGTGVAVGKEADKYGGVVLTGAKNEPNITIFDFGEGQEPKQFPRTFCGMSESNKQKIMFVQGKHCAGGTGALSYAQDGIQLVISRRSPKLNEKNVSNDIGFTVTRKYPVGDRNVKSPEYKYLVINGSVPSFPFEPLKILPCMKNRNSPYEKDWEYGAFIKLFNYDLRNNTVSSSVPDFSRKMSLHLVNPVFPVRCYDRRPNQMGKSPEQTMSGVVYRLRDDRNEVEDSCPFGATFSVDNQEFRAQIYVLKRSVKKGTLKSRWHGDNGIMFTMNGQVNAYKSNSLYRRNSVDLNYIYNKIITIIDCSDIDADHNSDFFMVNRERLKKTAFSEKVEEELIEILKNHQGLKDLNASHRREAVKDHFADNKAMEDILENLLKKDASLNNILLKGLRISAPFGINPNAGAFVPNNFPTFFKLDKKHSKFNKSNPRLVEKSRKSIFTFITDAPDDYFTRNTDPGNYSVSIDGQLQNNKPTFHGTKGVWQMHLDIDSNFKINQSYKIQILIDDISRTSPFKETFYIDVKPYSKRITGGSGSRSSGNRGKGKNKSGRSLKLPPIIELREEDWEERGWNKESGFLIVENGNSFDTFINMDNIYLQDQLKSSKNQHDIDLLNNYFKIGFSLVALNVANLSKKDKNVDTDKLCEHTSLALGPIIIPLIKDIGSAIDA